MFYSTGVTNELVQMLGLSDKTLPGHPGLKPSSNSVLSVAWITRPATDLRPNTLVFEYELNKVFYKIILFFQAMVNQDPILRPSAYKLANNPCLRGKYSSNNKSRSQLYQELNDTKAKLARLEAQLGKFQILCTYF